MWSSTLHGLDSPIKIFGSGKQICNLLYAEDAADTLWIAAR